MLTASACNPIDPFACNLPVGADAHEQLAKKVKDFRDIVHTKAPEFTADEETICDMATGNWLS